MYVILFHSLYLVGQSFVRVLTQIQYTVAQGSFKHAKLIFFYFTTITDSFEPIPFTLQSYLALPLAEIYPRPCAIYCSMCGYSKFLNLCFLYLSPSC